MAEGKVRLVLCPKCEKVLPELADYSVYQCGGCGAVLRAKIRDSVVDALSDKSDEERVEGVFEKFDKFSEKEMVSLNGTSEVNDKLNNSSFRCDQRVSENGDVPNAGKCKTVSKFASDKWVVENDFDLKMHGGEFGNANTGAKVGGLESRIENASGSQKSGGISDRKIGEIGEIGGFRRSLRTDAEGVRFSTSNSLNEGSSYPHADSHYGYRGPLRNHNSLDGSNRVECIGQDRAELLRKLDELKDQLSQSREVVDKSKEKVPQDRRMVHQEPYGGSASCFSDGSSGLNRASILFGMPDKHDSGLHYFNQYPEPHPLMDRHDMAMQGIYPSMSTSNHIPVYRDPNGSHMLRRAPHQAPYQYQHQPSHLFSNGQYLDADIDPYAPYPHNMMLHQPSCSCLHCYGQHRQVPGSAPPTAFCSKKFPEVPNNHMFYHHEKPNVFGTQVYNPRSTNPPPLNSCDAHARWPSDLISDMGAFVHCRPQRVVVANTSRRCRPVSGGAPFITCCNCFELLQLPKKVLLVEKNQRKMRCGACSMMIILVVVNKKIVVLPHSETKQAPSEVNDVSNDVVNRGASHSHGHLKQGSLNFYSDESAYDFQSMDREPVSSSTGQGFDSSKSQEMPSLHSSSLSTSEDEDCPDSSISPRLANNSVESPVKAIMSPPPPGSPLQEHFDYSSNNHAVNRFGKGNRSTRSDQEKVMSNKSASRSNSVKGVSLATEMEVSFNEYSATVTSQDSADVSREEDPPRNNRGNESFFAGIIKKSFKDFSRSNQAVEFGRTIVTINGHLIPDRSVKKAERVAGPIRPGRYWYDFRAGFWGVLGGPCLGIIPPKIEEFNYPMPGNCAGGNTGVFVNGRELHHKDLDLLSSRGLPTGRDRSYIIEISGRVLDEDTGEELDSLGRLAPTVERARHGFGMKVPRSAA